MLTLRSPATRLLFSTLAAVAFWVTSDIAVAKDIKICLIASKSGALADSARDVEAGFMIGLGFATNGTMKIGDDKISTVAKDDQLKPDLGKALLAECYDNDKADIAVVASSRTALATMPIAEQRKKILITPNGREMQDNSNRYVFHAGISSVQETAAEVATIPPGEDVSIGMLTEDVTTGRRLSKLYMAVLASLRPRAKVVAEEYVPSGTASIAPSAERLFNALKDRPGKRVIALIWFGGLDPFGPEPAEQLARMKPERFNIILSTRASVLPDLDDLKSAAGAEGSIFYHHSFPKNPANDWLKAAYRRYSDAPPDFFAVHGFAAASAAVTALARAGSTDPEKLIAVMEGMSFETPKGTMTFRKEDHQVLQDMYHWRIGRGGKVELVATIPAGDIPSPIAPSK